MDIHIQKAENLQHSESILAQCSHALFWRATQQKKLGSSWAAKCAATVISTLRLVSESMSVATGTSLLFGTNRSRSFDASYAMTQLKDSILNLTPIFQPNYQTLEGSFSAVWTATIATKYSFCRVFRDLQDLQSFAPLRSQNFNKNSSNVFFKFLLKFL